MAVDQGGSRFYHPLFEATAAFPGVDLAFTTADKVLAWGAANAMWIFPMATSCCGIEFMATACSRFDTDRMGVITRGTPRQADVMIIAGTITVKMAPRVKKLWDQMPEPKWAIAMGSCAISGDFYRDIYSVVPGVDTFLPVDVYVPGCPPNPDHLLLGLRRLQDQIKAHRMGEPTARERRPVAGMRTPSVPRLGDPDRDPAYSQAQVHAAVHLDPAGGLLRADAPEAPRPARTDGEST